MGEKKVKDTEEPRKAARVTPMTVRYKTHVKLMIEKAGVCRAT